MRSDPHVNKAKSLVCNAYKSGLPDEVIQEYREQLRDAKAIAKVKRIAEEIFDFPADSPVREQARAILAGV
jgi:hypothetical protein